MWVLNMISYYMNMYEAGTSWGHLVHRMATSPWPPRADCGSHGASEAPPRDAMSWRCQLLDAESWKPWLSGKYMNVYYSLETKALRQIHSALQWNASCIWAASTWCAPRTMERSPSPSCKHWTKHNATQQWMQWSASIEVWFPRFYHVFPCENEMKIDEDRWSAKKSWCFFALLV